MRVLLIEDDSATAQSIELMLKSESFNVYTTDLGEEGVDLGKLYDYDIILLDLNLPDMSGYEVLRSLRVAKVKTPILILSGLAGIEDKVKGLGFGADDYLTKPFHRDELVARIHAIVRRSMGHAQSVVRCADLVVNLDAKRAEIAGRPVALTGKEYGMLSSSSMVGQQMAVSFGIKLDDSLVNGAVEVIRAGEGLMSEVMPLQVAPDPFNIVQLRGVFRQPLDREPVGARREGSAACLTRVDRAVVEDKHDGLEHDPELGTIAPINLLQQSNEVRASVGPAGAHDEATSLATSPIEHAEHRYFGALARGRNAQVGPLLGPDVRQIRMGERFGLVREQKHDVARLGLRFKQFSA